jgi:Flp pilus assembly protein CpaB
MAGSELGTVTAVTGVRPAEREVRAPRVIERRRGLPGGRAALGGLLIAIAAVGVFVAYEGAGKAPADRVVAAAREIHVGRVIEAADLRVVLADLPSSARSVTFASTSAVLGHVALGPIGPGEMLQASGITTERSESGANEVAIALPRNQLAVGHLREGDRVDIFVTYKEGTRSVVRGAEVVLIGSDHDRSLTSDREISIVVAVPSGDVVAALVHAMRTGEVTVVRSTFAELDDGDPLVFEAGGAPSTRTASSG